MAEHLLCMHPALSVVLHIAGSESKLVQLSGLEIALAYNDCLAPVIIRAADVPEKQGAYSYDCPVCRRGVRFGVVSRVIPVSPHTALALGLLACRQGKRVRFVTATGLVNELLEAQEQHTLGKRLAQLQKPDLLIVDEVGFVPFTPDGARLLFQVCADRYLRGSLLITTNLEFGRWVEVFGDERLTGALLDRLTHHCHVLEFNGDSYRFKESLRQQETGA